MKEEDEYIGDIYIIRKKWLVILNFSQNIFVFSFLLNMGFCLHF